MKKTFEIDFAGRHLSVETGEIAKQADGAALVRFGETVTLSTAVASDKPRDGDFFPLTVNYDRLCAADAPQGNSVLMLLRLLRLCGASQALLAGADGYREGENAYAEGRLHTHTDRGAAYNAQVAAALRAIQAGGLPIAFVTPSEYASSVKVESASNISFFMCFILLLFVPCSMTKRFFEKFPDA